MNKLITVLLASLFATASFGAAHMGTPATGTNPATTEAMKPGDAAAQGKAQAKVDARKATDGKSGMQHQGMQQEAMKAGSEKAQAKAEAKKAGKAKVGKKNSTDDQMKKDAAKL